MTQPGLSKFADRPEEAAKSLDVLLAEAVKVVPSSLQSCTPVVVKATAGLRLLKPSQSNGILNAVKKHLKTKYPFPLDETNGVAIMDGKDEGVYAWITANYLLDTIRADSPAGAHTYAVLDLGGGSTDAAVADGGEVRSVHLAGAGDLVTRLIGSELGLEDRELAEQVRAAQKEVCPRRPWIDDLC